jgi:hypothetical protein
LHYFGNGKIMTDLKQLYINAFTARADLIRDGETNEAVLQAYESLLNVISNDVRFRAETYIELSQPSKD